MEQTHNGYLIVRTKQDITDAKKGNELMVYVICPECYNGSTSVLANAEQTIKKGCLLCAKEKWNPELLNTTREEYDEFMLKVTTRKMKDGN